jgi:EAL domain-containing protein (putative c-di-GMP-specific phosphodiesterase class I)
LVRILASNPTTSFSLNIDPQELEYAETFTLFEELVEYKERLIIEITEKLPLQRNYSYFSSMNIEALKTIYQLGYQIALDDVGQGVNSLDNVIAVKDYIDIIKFSSLSFRRKISEESLHDIIVLFASIASHLEKTFVVEGIEDQEFASWLEENISCYHQGYLYSTPANILTIDY